MDGRMKFSLIPDWVYWIAIAALIAVVGTQELRIGSLKTDVAQEKTGRATELALRTDAALKHATVMSTLAATHATKQQEKEDANNAKINKLETEQRAGAVVADRLRGKLAAYAASSRRPGETDTAAIERYESRLGVVSSLLGESVDLLNEGRGIIGRRDIEVKNLLDQIAIDRLACQAGASVVPQP
jgi:hypothetical protein